MQFFHTRHAIVSIVWRAVCWLRTPRTLFDVRPIGKQTVCNYKYLRSFYLQFFVVVASDSNSTFKMINLCAYECVYELVVKVQSEWKWKMACVVCATHDIRRKRNRAKGMKKILSSWKRLFRFPVTTCRWKETILISMQGSAGNQDALSMIWAPMNVVRSVSRL